MKIINGKQYYTTTEVSKKINKKIATILKYARTRNDIYKTGSKQATKYLWTEENINDYLEYSKIAKIGRPSLDELDFSEKYDTLYHRMIRAKKSGNIERYEETKKIIEELKQKNKLIPQKRNRKKNIYTE